MDAHILTVILLGIVEGLTEFLPVSSTGHLILASELLGYDAKQWALFNIVIQLGAILAVVVLYWRTFWAVLHGMIRGNAVSWRFVRNLLVAFIPAALIGLILHNQIRSDEHTSELQSLMRISYAVLCLKKKNKHITNTSHYHHED